MDDPDDLAGQEECHEIRREEDSGQQEREETEEVWPRGRRAQNENQQVGDQASCERGGDEREIALERAERGDIDRYDERKRAKEQLPASHKEEDDAYEDGARDEI